MAVRNSPALSSLLRVCVLIFTLSLAAYATANSVPADQQSLLNGSDLYSMHCAECHGWTMLDNFRQRQEDDLDVNEYDFSELVDGVYGLEEEEIDNTVYIEDEEAWPEWAEFPDPGIEANDPGVRAQIMDDFTSAIDDVYAPDLATSELENSYDIIDELDVIDPNGPVAGATELQSPDTFYFGTSEQELYNSIERGFDSSMPGFADKLDSEDRIWDLVNFIRSFWYEDDGLY